MCLFWFPVSGLSCPAQGPEAHTSVGDSVIKSGIQTLWVLFGLRLQFGQTTHSEPSPAISIIKAVLLLDTIVGMFFLLFVASKILTEFLGICHSDCFPGHLPRTPNLLTGKLLAIVILSYRVIQGTLFLLV